jgi:hypothetical protein
MNLKKLYNDSRLLFSSADKGGADRGTQHLLSLAWTQYSELELRDVEFRNHSQNGEDGILLYLFTHAGHGTRRAIEISAGDGIQCNTANLFIHHDWDVLMLDGNKHLLENGKKFYRNHSESFRLGPTLKHAWITAENVNEVLAENGYDRDIDLLSLDIDGVDYWILKAIEIRPRILVVEYNNRIPSDLSLTVPYRSDFSASGGAFNGDGFFGASLAAFNKLLSGRGYRLVGANRHNTNAFFLRTDVFPQRSNASVASCLSSQWASHQREKWDQVAQQPWIEV